MTLSQSTLFDRKNRSLNSNNSHKQKDYKDVMNAKTRILLLKMAVVDLDKALLAKFWPLIFKHILFSNFHIRIQDYVKQY